jgi:chromosome segregation ATPase
MSEITPAPSPGPPPKRSGPVYGGGLAARVWDAVKKLAAASEYLRSLEKEDARIQSQIAELSRNMLELFKEVRDLSGQMKGIEKRLEDKDKLVEATVKLRII